MWSRNKWNSTTNLTDVQENGFKFMMINFQDELQWKKFLVDA